MGRSPIARAPGARQLQRDQVTAVVNELDVLRGAKVVLDHHGPDALTHAARRADALLERGDVQGYELWLAILAVLESARAHLPG
jgi:hypothetical protein